MMTRAVRRLVLALGLLCLLQAGASARNYVVVLAATGFRGSIYDMNSDGLLRFRDYYVCNEFPEMKTSADNRLIAEGEYSLNLLFFNETGTRITIHEALDEGYWQTFLAMDPLTRKFYAGPDPYLRTYSFDPDLATYTSRTQSRSTPFPHTLTYSGVARTLYFHSLSGSGKKYQLQGYKLKENDAFDTLTTVTYVGRHSLRLVSSHDGRMLVSVGQERPQIKIYKVHPDGLLAHVQDIQVEPGGNGIQAFFSPDDAWLYLTYDPLSVNKAFASSYAINPDTLQASHYMTVSDGPWRNLDGYAPEWVNPACSITPDGRFLVIPYWQVMERRSCIGLVRLNGGEMELLPIQQLGMRDFFTASGVAMFNTNATAPGWAQHE